MNPEIAAVHHLAGAIAEGLKNVCGRTSEEALRLAVVQVNLDNLIASLVIDRGYPELPDAAADDIRKTARRIRSRVMEGLAELQAVTKEREAQQ